MTSGRAGRIHWYVAAIWMIGLFTLQFVAQHALAADRLWNLPQNGVFSEPANWFGGVPGENDVARCETTNSNSFQRTYTVDFTTNPANQQLVVEDDGVTFNLMGRTYELKNTFEAAALRTEKTFDYQGKCRPSATKLLILCMSSCLTGIAIAQRLATTHGHDIKVLLAPPPLRINWPVFDSPVGRYRPGARWARWKTCTRLRACLTFRSARN